MRALKPNETLKKRRGGIIEYYDDLNRNTFYNNPHQFKWYNKEWLRLSNGQDVETYVSSNTGYWRKHEYDCFTGVLLKEWDSNNNTDLLHKRKQWNPNDTQRSQEFKTRSIQESHKY